MQRLLNPFCQLLSNVTPFPAIVFAMSKIAKYEAGVRQLDTQLAAVVALSNLAAPPPDDVLLAARWAVVRTLAKVAALQETFLFAPLEAHDDPAMAAQGATLKDSMQAGMQQLIVYADRWSAGAVREDWQGYRRALRVAHAVIHDHFAWANAAVPPLLAALEGASAAPKRNWTRPIWAVQESLMTE